jgi:hypothetical protein
MLPPMSPPIPCLSSTCENGTEFHKTYENTSTHAQKCRLASSTTSRCEVAIVRVDGSSVNIAYGFEVHDRLRLGCASVEDATFVVQRIEEQIGTVLLTNPGHERSV